MSSLRRILPLIPRHSPSIPNGVPSVLQSTHSPHVTTYGTTTSNPTSTARNLTTTTTPNPPKAPKRTEKPTTLAEHEAHRAAVKAHRTDLHATKVLNRTRQKSTRRRDSATKDHLRRTFRAWYDPFTIGQGFLDREARRRGMPWRHRVAVLIERPNVVLPDFQGWMEEWDMMRGEMDRYGKVWPKELGFVDPMDLEVMTREELMAELPEGFTPMPRETEADKSGLLRTLDRRLKTRVYLAVRPDDADGWTVPTKDLREGGSSTQKDETIVDCARRAVGDVVGDGDLKVVYVSNCPMGVTMASYDEMGVAEEEGNEGFFGVKTFYLRVQYDSGALDEERLGKVVGDWGWLERCEMVEKVTEEKGEDLGKFYHYLL